MDTDTDQTQTTDASPLERTDADDTTDDDTTDDAGVESASRSGPPGVDDRYADLDLDREVFVVYDRENADAWVQSDRPASLPDAGGELDG
jgi:hypothetical protein